MATQAVETAAVDAKSVFGEVVSLFKSVEVILATLLAIATTAGTFLTNIPRELQIAIFCVAALLFLAVITAKVVMPAIEARRRRRIIALPDPAHHL